MSFVHLHVHSSFSFRYGAIRPEALASAAGALGMPAVALTDHLGLAGMVRFLRACHGAGVRPILGAEVPIAPPAGVPDPAEAEGASLPPDRRSTPELRRGCHTVLLVQSATGYANLCRLLSEMHLDERGGAPSLGVSWEAFCRHAEGLLVLSGCERGEVGRWLGLRDVERATATVRRFVEVCGWENYSLEVHHHLLPDSATRVDRVLALGRRLGVRVVATNDACYLQPEDAEVHDLLLAMRELAPLTAVAARRGGARRELCSPQEMRRRFAGAEWVCDASLTLAEQCRYVPTIRHDAPYRLGGGPPPATGPFRLPPVRTSGGVPPAVALEQACEEGLARRMPGAGAGVRARLDGEMAVIRRLGFCGYFLLVAEIVAGIKAMGVRCACRGSAAGSLVTHLLGISDVDPVHHDLSFARFLNEYRSELPDVDVDVESARRDDILAWIARSYGAERTSMVAAVATYRVRGAIRGVGRALGLPEVEVDTIARQFPLFGSAGAIEETVAALPELAGVRLDAPHVRDLFARCAVVDGFPRYLAMHASGVLIGPDDFRDLVPLQRAPSGLPMAQFDKDDVEALGLVKLDVLGVRMQSAIAHALEEVARVRGETVDVDAVPRDDPATFELIRSGRTLGCFQIESPGQRELLGKFQPTEFPHLIVDISLFRPGPVKSDMVNPFVERHHGAPVECASPLLDAILSETHGVIVYHEQVIRTIAALGGVSEAEADAVRRRLGDPDDPETVEIGEWLQARAVARGIAPAEAAAVWGQVRSFASFGFCKAHAAAFAVTTYQSAWLKTHEPAAFLAGVLTHDPGMYPRRLFVHEARRCGVAVLPLDVNVSDAAYRVEPLRDQGESSLPP